jgi:hypothetical protein
MQGGNCVTRKEYDNTRQHLISFTTVLRSIGILYILEVAIKVRPEACKTHKHNLCLALSYLGFISKLPYFRPKSYG